MGLKSAKSFNVFFYTFVSFFFSCQVMAIEEPKFKILVDEGELEIRSYDEYLVAETAVEGLLILQVEKVFVGLQDIFLAKIKIQVVRVRKSR